MINSYKDLDDVNENELREYEVKVKAKAARYSQKIKDILKSKRVNNLRQKFSEAATTGRSCRGHITIYYDELVKIWVGSPFQSHRAIEVAPHVSFLFDLFLPCFQFSLLTFIRLLH